MGLIAFLAASGMIVIKIYRWLTASQMGPVLDNAKQSVAVLGTFANAFFAVLDALTTLRVASVSRTSAGSPTVVQAAYSRPAGYAPPGLREVIITP